MLTCIRNKDVIKDIVDYLFISKGIALGIEIVQKEVSIIPNSLDRYLEYLKIMILLKNIMMELKTLIHILKEVKLLYIKKTILKNINILN